MTNSHKIKKIEELREEITKHDVLIDDIYIEINKLKNKVGGKLLKFNDFDYSEFYFGFVVGSFFVLFLIVLFK